MRGVKKEKTVYSNILGLSKITDRRPTDATHGRTADGQTDGMIEWMDGMERRGIKE